MLHLSTRAARRVGASYVCAKCLAASNPPVIHRAALIPHRDRYFSTTSPRANPTTESQPTPAADSSDPLIVSKSEPPATSSSPPKKKKKRSKKPAATPAATPAAKLDAKKEDGGQPDAVRQLHVLEGALAALRNVLAAQNIDVENIKHVASSKKTDGDKKPKSESKSAKDDTKEAQKDAKKKAVSLKTPRALGKMDAADLQKALMDADLVTSQSSSKTSVVNSGSKKAPKKTARKSARASRKTRGRKEVDSASPAEQTPESPEDLTKAGPDVRPVKGKSKKGYPVLPYNAIGNKTVGKPFSGEPHPKKSKSRKASDEDVLPLSISKIDAKDLALAPVDAVRAHVPSLSYGLERVLFNPGVYYLQDPRSRVFNFDPYLSKIMPLQEFDFTALKQYVTSSKDSNLISISKEHGKKYTGSTSSMTSMLAHFHYLISSWRDINTEMLSRTIQPDSLQFTRINRAPATVFLHWKDGTYAIDADKEFDTANILSMLGKSMEKLLTLPKEDFERYRHINSDQITQEEREAEEAFHYTGFEDFMMRSQLDAHDPRVPGTGMFDLKTRAVVSIRMDAKGFQKGLGYEIRDRFGQWESFEREYYDMIRSAFMKYSLQVRMGRMDGIFVAFHNTERIFGFQYISLPEMDLTLHGTSDTTLGDHEFKFSLSLLNKILNRASEKFPEKSLRLHFETRTSVGSPFMYVFAKPVEPEDIDEVQNASKATIEAFERNVMGLHKDNDQAEQAELATGHDEAIEDEEIEENETPKTQELQSLDAWEEVRQTVEDAMEDDEVGVGTVREAIEDALEESGLIRAKSSEEARGYVDALLAAITGTEHPRPVESSNSPSEEVLNEDGEETAAESVEENAAENVSAIESEDSSGAQTPEVEKEPSSPAEATEESELSQKPDSDISQALESTSHGSETLTGSQEAHETSVDSEASSSIDETSQDQTQITAETPVESEDAEQDEERAVQEEEDELDEDEDVAESKEDATSGSDMSPLKDLIVRMAQRIDERPVSEEDNDDSLNYSSKLNSFERILGELISSARTLETKQQPTTSDPESLVAEEAQSDKPVETIAESTNADADDALGSGSTEASEDTVSQEIADEAVEKGDLLGMVLTIKNKVNGHYVKRPSKLTEADEWILEYNIEDIPDARAHRFYNQCKARRQKVLQDPGDKEIEWYQMFRGQLDTHTKKGREFRAREEEKNQVRPVHVVGLDEPLKWTDVFGGNSDVGAASSEANSDVEADAAVGSMESDTPSDKDEKE
ncbi:hypothetical protein MGN70_002378 [Eutypa lata]|nr:hypothetical protein MGN70_002378 [Eutypa lata]